MNEETLFHLGIPVNFKAKYAILPGDPGRVPLIAGFLENPKPLAAKREYCSYSGTVRGETVIVCSTGIGGPSASIAVEELHLLGVETFIRIGTCGGMQTNILSGDLIIPTAAIRHEGTSLHYAPIEFPAAASFDVVLALKQSAVSLNAPSHTGVVHCKDSFYGQHSPEKSPVSDTLLSKWASYKRLGALASEMETAALFTVCAALGAKAGCVLNCIWNQERDAAGLENPINEDMTIAINCAVGAIKILK